MTTQELIEKTKQLIKIRSTADNPAAQREAVQFVADAVKQECPDVTIEWFESNGKRSFLAYREAVRPKKFKILLNGHVDVVPATDEQFEPYVKDGRLYGRGALDMKGTTLALAKVFCEMVNEVPYDLALQIVCDEEVGGYDCVKVQINDGVRADFVVVGEYSNDSGTIYNAARGLCWAEIAFKGKASHGGHPWKGDNAIVKAGEFAGALLKRYPTPDRESWTTTANISSLTTPNQAYNKVPDLAVLKVDFRFTQEDEVFRSKESLTKFIKSINPEAELMNVAVFEPAVNVEELNPFVQGLSAALRKHTKNDIRYLGRPGGSDGRHYALINVDVVEFGIYGQGEHSNNEYAELDSFDLYPVVLKDFLANPTPAGANEPKPVSLKSSDYVWYATFGSGLAKEHFLNSITGDHSPGDLREYVGCSDKTSPVKDEFIHLPYERYFSGSHPVHSDGGGCGFISTERSDRFSTIARAYLITKEQFAEIAAQENEYKGKVEMPYAQAKKNGVARLGIKGLYNALLYCGEKDGFSMFSLTQPVRGEPAKPSAAYMRILCKGLSEAKNVSRQEAVDYLLNAPGVSGYYHKKDITELFNE